MPCAIDFSRGFWNGILLRPCTFEGAKLLTIECCRMVSPVPISRSCLKLFKFLYVPTQTWTKYKLYHWPSSHSLLCEECPHFTYGTYSQGRKKKIQHITYIEPSRHTHYYYSLKKIRWVYCKIIEDFLPTKWTRIEPFWTEDNANWTSMHWNMIPIVGWRFTILH